MDKSNNKLFPQMEIAAKAIALCCNDDGKSPVAKSEVYNETWMLRLALAFIHDNCDNNIKAFDREKNALLRIAKAVKRRWISEGGLTPVFKMEGPTWTDAILGNVILGKEDVRPAKMKKTKRGVAIDNTGDCAGVIVIEAKMNSDIAPGVTHAGDYNQIARNIACLAWKVMEYGTIAKESAFFVFAPESKISNCKIDGYPIKDYLDYEKVWKTISNQFQSEVDAPEKQREFRKENYCADEQFRTTIKQIIDNSLIISWEDIIQSVECDESMSLTNFYLKTCEEYKIKTRLTPN